jgi:hypothetical protein
MPNMFGVAPRGFRSRPKPGLAGIAFINFFHLRHGDMVARPRPELTLSQEQTGRVVILADSPSAFEGDDGPFIHGRHDSSRIPHNGETRLDGVTRGDGRSLWLRVDPHRLPVAVLFNLRTSFDVQHAFSNMARRGDLRHFSRPKNAGGEGIKEVLLLE